MELNFIELISIISALISIIPIPFLFRRRELHKNYYSVTWKLSRYLTSGDLLGERPFYEYYERREVDQKIIRALKVHHNVLIKGPSLAGKSRAIFEALKHNKESFDILIPICREIELNSFTLPYRARFWRKGLVILDDLQRLVEQPGFERLLREIIVRRYVIVASTRTGKDFRLVESAFARQGLDLKSLFGECEIEIPSIDEGLARELAGRIKKEWGKISFNGTIGSVFMEIFEMKNRFSTASESEKSFLRSLKKLYDCGVYLGKGEFPISWVRIIYNCDDYQLNIILESLELKEFCKLVRNLIEIEPVYLEEIILPFPKKNIRTLCNEIANLFDNNAQVLLKIGDRLLDLGRDDINIKDYLIVAILQYRKVLLLNQFSEQSYEYATTLNNLGMTYAMLSDIEDKADNSKHAIEAHQKALKIFTIERFPIAYALTQHNLGIVYGIIAEVEDREKNSNYAIAACNEALKIFSKDRFPRAYAMTYNNIGIAYGILAKLHEDVNIIEKSVSAFSEAVNILTVDRFPDEYALTQLNLGNGYANLAENTFNKDLCEKSINAYDESLKIFTIQHHPRDYAMAQNGLGCASRFLGKFENNTANCRRAILAFKKALEVFTIEIFPAQYAEVQSNLALTYWTLAGNDVNIENIQLAIDSWKNSLKIFSLQKFPNEYAKIQNNLGAAYLSIAQTKNRPENCRLAIIACNESLKVRVREEHPSEYATSQFNLGTAHAILAEVENKKENCRFAWEAYENVIKICSVKNFPIQYAQLRKNIEMLESICGKSKNF